MEKFKTYKKWKLNGNQNLWQMISPWDQIIQEKVINVIVTKQKKVFFAAKIPR